MKNTGFEQRGFEQMICELVRSQPKEEGSLMEQVAQILRECIVSGEIPAGTKIPTQRALSQSIGISRRTVSTVYDLLRKEGYLVSRQGSGTWVGEDTQQRSKVQKVSQVFSGRSVSFAMANLSALPMVEESLISLKQFELSDMMAGNGYENFGLSKLREEIVSYYNQMGLPTKEEEILITNGAQQAIMLIARLFLSHGTSVIVEDPTYSGAIDAFRLSGADLKPIIHRAGGVDIDELRTLVRKTQPQFIYVVPVHNPTGVFMSGQVRTAIAEICSEYGVTIVEDLSLSNITLNGPAPEPLAKIGSEAPILSIGTTSKIFWGGLRVGWIRAQRSDIQKLARLKSVEDLGGSLISQYIAARVFPHIEEAAAYVREIAAARLMSFTQQLSCHLPEWKWAAPDGGFSLWVKLPEKVATSFTPIAEKHGVSIIPGPLLSCRRGFEDYLRLSFVLSEKEAEEGVRRLADAWAVFRQNTEKDLNNIIVI